LSQKTINYLRTWRYGGYMGIRGRGVTRRVVLGLVMAGIAAAPASAGGATTIGGSLAVDPTNAGACSLFSVPCTIAEITVTGRTLQSPINGVITRWRVRASDVGTTDLALRVVRFAGSGIFPFTGRGTSEVQTFPSTGVTTIAYPARLPVEKDDRIGLNVGTNNNNFVIFTPVPDPSTSGARWEPPLADGATTPATTVFSGATEATFNADVEPDIDCDQLGDETQDPAIGPRCPVVTITRHPRSKIKAAAGKKGTKVRFEFATDFSPGFARWGFVPSDVHVLCRIDNRVGNVCQSPWIRRVQPGRHTFTLSVNASNQFQYAAGTGSSFSFKVKKRH
jgi:hypothetical protein